MLTFAFFYIFTELIKNGDQLEEWVNEAVLVTAAAAATATAASAASAADSLTFELSHNQLLFKSKGNLVY